VAHRGEERKLYKVSAGNPEGKGRLGRPRRLGDGIRMNLGETGLGGGGCRVDPVGSG
jgi:hypothetical protein